MDALDIWNGFNIVESCIISICSAFSELASWPYSQSPASSRPEILKEADCSSMSAYISICTTTNSPAQKNRVFMKAYFFTVFCTKDRGMKTFWPSPLPLTPYENLTGKGVLLRFDWKAMACSDSLFVSLRTDKVWLGVRALCNPLARRVQPSDPDTSYHSSPGDLFSKGVSKSQLALVLPSPSFLSSSIR